MTRKKLRIVFLGLTVTSSWGNGHATTYRSLMRGLVRRGHDVLFLERDKPWYAAHRDTPGPSFGTIALYDDTESLCRLWGGSIAQADLVVVGSYVPDGIEVGHLVQRLAEGATAFYDIDTPVTLAALEAGTCEYLSPDLLQVYDLYLSFTGGPTLVELQRRWGARKALTLYCAADTDLYFPTTGNSIPWDLGYLGTFSSDRQQKLHRLLFSPAQAWEHGKFVVAGSLYPPDLCWPANVARIEHLPPTEHREFYAAQRFTLNITRGDMVRRGWSPSVRLFEAASCGTPIISDSWDGLDTLFRPGREIIIVRDEHDVLEALQSLSEASRIEIGTAARTCILARHTADHRAAELEGHVLDTVLAMQQQRIA